MRRRVDKRLSGESGFTLIELLVAATILVIGIFGLVTSVNTSHKLSDVSEHETVASQVADRELDLARTIPYLAVALSTDIPASGGTATADATRWNAWLTSGILPHPGTAFACTSASSSNNNPALPNDEQTPGCIVSCQTAPSAGCPAVGKLAPVSTVSVPTVSGTLQKLKIYRYVTWVNDLACGQSCPNPSGNGYRGDYKRVTIAVLPVLGATSTSGVAATASINGPRQPVVVSAIRNDPTLGTGNASGGASPCGVGGVEC
jgi:prepilin-type N-terminal cleavage/methylation domain-containing protein